MNKNGSLQLWILEQLAIYKFLCPSQFYLLGTTVSSKTLYENLGSLRQRNLCGKSTYRYTPKFGRLEDVHFLKPKGKKLLVNLCGYVEEDIKIPSGQVKMIEQYHHRKMIISIHIAIRKACQTREIDLKFFDGDFERRKSKDSKRKEGATKISTSSTYLRADAIFLILFNKDHFLFCVELHNQYRVAKIVNQLKPYAFALAAGTPSIKYNINRSARVLVVFEKPSTMKSALEIVCTDNFYLYLRDYILFKTYDDVLVDPLDRRINLKKEQVSLLPISS